MDRYHKLDSIITLLEANGTLAPADTVFEHSFVIIRHGHFEAIEAL